jgi:quercetin dioxygenase-like cupin family protein
MSDLPKHIGGHAELAWGHVVCTLERARMTVADIIKVTQYLTRADDIPAYGKVRTRFLGTVAAICAALAFAVAELASAHGVRAETVTPKFDQVIPNIPGKSLIVVEVDYAPDAASRPHRHAKSAFIYAYVISGEIESKVNNGETRIYKAGEGWSEPPNANHPISRNASKTKPAKLLAVFVVDSDDKPLTTPVK